MTKKRRIISSILIGLTIITALTIGIGSGIIIAVTLNTDVRKILQDYKPALPSQILDKNGELITELFADEKRDVVPLNELPKHLIYAFIAREDKNFYSHKGYEILRMLKAFWTNLTTGSVQGASTITQQVASRRLTDGPEISYIYKLKELWWAFQLERSLTKDEILELYLNEESFGHNVNGVEAASQYYFKHSAREITLAESAILVPLLSAPTKYSPIRYPEAAKDRQRFVLDRMIELGYTTPEEAELSIDQFWTSYDYTRSNISSAYVDFESNAPYFDRYVQDVLLDERELYGAVDLHRDGYIIHTTLDMSIQRIARKTIDQHLFIINEKFQRTNADRQSAADEIYTPIIDMLSLVFNLEDIKVQGVNKRKQTKDYYYKTINPTLNILSLMLGIDDLNSVTRKGYLQDTENSKKTTIEGALITIDNHTGHIVSMVGGSDWETKKYNRAVDAEIMPGSCFKPLYYSAAISSGKYNVATWIYDGPLVYYDDYGREFRPENFLGRWEGSVLLRRALATSMNVPSIQVLMGTGYEVAIERASLMLGMEDQKDDRELFPRSYNLGLGLTSVAPINMARAFATFPNQGKAVVPMGVLRVENRDGNIILDYENKRLSELKYNENSVTEIMTPQEAYIMTSILTSTVEMGTLRWPSYSVGGYDKMVMAGKTGTTQNWGDAWTVGFSPYYTTAIWFGFDTPGISMGRHITGSTAVGPAWAQYMKEVHTDLIKIEEFKEPETGLVRVQVCRKSGLLPGPSCNEGTITEVFIIGTQPTTFCEIHPSEVEIDSILLDHIQDNMLFEDISTDQFFIDDPFNIDSGEFNFDTFGLSPTESDSTEDMDNKYLD